MQLYKTFISLLQNKTNARLSEVKASKNHELCGQAER